MRPMYAVAILFLLAGCSSVPAEKTRAIPANACSATSNR